MSVLFCDKRNIRFKIFTVAHNNTNEKLTLNTLCLMVLMMGLDMTLYIKSSKLNNVDHRKQKHTSYTIQWVPYKMS